MKSVRWLFAVSIACALAGIAFAGTKQTCKAYLAEFHPAIGILPQVTGLDGFSADPENPGLRVTTRNMLGYQDTAKLQALAKSVSSAYERREECSGDVGKKVVVEGASVNPAEFVAYIEALHDHGVPLIAEVIDEREARDRSLEERARADREIDALTATWAGSVDGLAAGRDEAVADAAAVAALREATTGSASLAGKCLARAYLLRVRPLGDDFADDVRAFRPCLDLPADEVPPGFGDLVKDQAFLGANDARNRDLGAGRSERAIREWAAVLETFGDQREGPWTDPARDGLPDEVRGLAGAVADAEWPTRSRIQLGMYCMSRKDAACVERLFVAGGDGLSVSEHTLGTIADDLGEAGNPLAVDLWEFLARHGALGSAYLEKRVAFQVAHGAPGEIRGEIARLIAAGECARAARMTAQVASSGGSTDPLADAEALLPCTRDRDEDTARAAWEAVGEAYRDALGGMMQSSPQRLGEAVALARKALDIPERFRPRSVTDYARYVLEVSEARASGIVDTAQARRDRFDACTQALAAIEWKRRKEDDTYVEDLTQLRAHCCSFLQSNRADWIAWMRSKPESSDARGRTFRREFTAEEVENKQANLDRYCSER